MLIFTAQKIIYDRVYEDDMRLSFLKTGHYTNDDAQWFTLRIGHLHRSTYNPDGGNERIMPLL